MLRPSRLLALGLSLVLLLFATLPAAAEELIPGSPPMRPEKPWTAPLASAPSPSVQCTTGHCVFLPLIQIAPWINTNNRSASLRAYREQHVIPSPIDPQWTGSRVACAPGDTSAEFKAAILRRVNYFRGMAGVPAVITFDNDYSRKAQAAALMISVNRQTVVVPPPQGKCYSSEGEEAFRNSNLIIYGYGPDAIRGYMRDAGAGNWAVGHRRWLLYPQTRKMGAGDVPKAGDDPYANALWIFDPNLLGTRPQTRQAFVAWPPPGYAPYQVVFARWSFSYPNAYFDQAMVSMTDPNGKPVPVAIAPANVDYGENTLVWIPSGMADDENWPKPAGDTIYRMKISNVKIGLELRTFSYQVIVFDPDA